MLDSHSPKHNTSATSARRWPNATSTLAPRLISFPWPAPVCAAETAGNTDDLVDHQSVISQLLVGGIPTPLKNISQ